MNDMSPLNMMEPIFDVAQLAHVELLTPNLEGTLCFFKDLLGLEETEREGNSVYLRGYEEQYHHSLKVTAAPRAGLGHAAWRTRSPQALERRVAAIEAIGLGRGWIDGDVGHGRPTDLTPRRGHRMEMLWDVDYVTAPAGKETPLRNRPYRRPQTGVPVRRIDHLNLLCRMW
jgi:catechol 2,3-dioxygenase